MKNLVYVLIILPLFIFGQTDYQKQVDSIKFVKEMPYICEYGIADKIFNSGCGDNLYWDVVKLKDKVIQLLIDKLEGTTITEAYVPNFGGYYTTADIAFVALEEIIHDIPTFELLGVKYDEKGCGYCVYWQHLRKKIKNRKKFKKEVQKWYDANKDNLVWEISNSFSSCDCGGLHPNGGHYILR